VDALSNGTIALAAFDCYYEEPVPKLLADKYGLMKFEDSKFILTPHTAYNTTDAIANMENMAIENTLSILRGEPCKNMIK
jgi:lactate dehydrogenase-like 2-hydroxyacid dehydrogenase